MEKPATEYSEIGTKNHPFILVVVITSVVILIIILATFLFLSKPQSPSNSQTSKPNQTTLSPLQIEIQKCAIPTPSQKCILLYSTSDIEAECNQLKELKDQCLYNFATINERIDTCDIITSTTLKNKCQEEIELLFISDE